MLQHPHLIKSNSASLFLTPLVRALIIAGIATIASFSWQPNAMAAEGTQNQPAKTSEPRSFTIPAGTLDQVLNSYARETGILLVIDAALTAGKTSAGLTGSYSVGQGLAAILQSNGLAAYMQENGSYALRMAKETPASSKVPDTLPVVAVSSTRSIDEASSALTKGYVAKRAITATKTDTSILETPQAISVVTRDELDMRNVQRDGDALRYTAGVFTEGYGNDIRPGYDVGFIRGFDSSTTGMYRDGLRETNGFWSRISTDIVTTERIEVLKGPSSVLYGSGEPAGLINKVTKKPSDIPLRQIEVQAGNFDRYQGSFDVGGPVDSDGKVSYRVIGMARDSDTQYKYDNGHRSKDDRQVFAQSLTIKPSDKTTLTLQAEYLHAKTGVPFTVGTTTTATDIMVGDYTYDKNERTQTTYGYLFEHIFNDAVTFRQNLRVSDVDFRYQRMAQSGQIGNLIGRRKGVIDEQLKGFAIDNHAQIKFETGSIKHTALFGLDFQRASFTNRQGSTNPNLLNPAIGDIF